MRPVRPLAVLLLLATAAFSGGETVRCGKGWLERIDGYPVLHVEGTPYEMGWQQGSLFREECLALLRRLLTERPGEPTIDFLGQKIGARDAIALIWKIQERFVPPRFIEEMRGLADALGVPEEDVFHANLIPELFHCSGFALRSVLTEEGALLHGRVLDYGTDLGLQEHAVLILAKPEGRLPFANVSYAGFLGSVTGMNARQISVGEMGGGGLGKWMGTPMSFLVRRVLEEAQSLEEALAIFREAKRTCEYFYVVGDGEADDAAGVDGSADRFAVIRPGEAHPMLPRAVPDAVLLSAGKRYEALAGKVAGLAEAGRKLSVEEAIRLMDAPVAMRENLHDVLMAPARGKLWVANATPEGEPAWKQPYREFDVRALLGRRPPEGAREVPCRSARPAK
jgi:hypothetical protein